MNAIVFVTTAWGTRHGGLNAFNRDLARAVARAARSEVVVACLVPHASESEREQARADRVRLLELGPRGSQGFEDLDGVLHVIADLGAVTWWVGHDVHTGPICVRAARHTGARAAVVLHTAYSAYASFKGAPGEKILARELQTKELLRAADLVVGVGPKLAAWAEGETRMSSTPVVGLVPGLADVKGISGRPASFTAITFGRMDAENDGLKLGALAAAAFGQLVHEVPDVVGQDPKLYAVGVPDGDAERFRSVVEEAAGRRVAVIPAPFIEARDEMLELLGSASVCLMLSLHEGFGLTGWEAISARVPLVVSRNSGLYRFLDGVGGPAIGCVWPVEIRGMPGPLRYQPGDVEVVTRALREIALSGDTARRKADDLHRLLTDEYTWGSAARQLLEALHLPVRPGPRPGDQPPSSAPRTPRRPPPVIPGPLRDRQPPQQKALRDRLIFRDHPVTALVGSPGTGKTALVSQVFTDLEGGDHFRDLEYLSGKGPIAVTGHRLLESLAAMAAQVGHNTPVEATGPTDGDWLERVDQALQAVMDDVLLVIDQVEELLDDSGGFRDPGLDLVVDRLARSTDHWVTLLLVSNTPLDAVLGLGGRRAVMSLDGPLPPDQARLMLLDLWDQHPPERLRRDLDRAVELVGRYPRTLELLVPAFDRGDALQVDDLADLSGLSADACADRLVTRVLPRLTREQRTVIRTLSVMAVPSSARDVSDLLGGIWPGLPVGETLEVLTELRLIQRLGDRYDMPPAQARTVQREWWADEEGRHAREQFLALTAEHFELRAEIAEPQRLEDLEPHFREIEVLLDLQQNATALRRLDRLDEQYLRGWGHQYVLAPWRRRLEDWQVGQHPWRANLSGLAAGEIELDRLDSAESILKQALEGLSAGDEPDDPDRLALTNQLGLVHWMAGRPADALTLHDEQWRAAIAAGRTYEQARSRLGLASCLIDLGRLDEAAGHLQEAERLTADPGDDTARRRLLSQILLAQATLARLRARYSDALHLAKQAIAAAKRSGNQLTRVRALAHFAGVLLDQGEYGAGPEAVEKAERAASEVSLNGVADVTRTAHTTLALAYLHADRIQEARRAAEAAAHRFFPSRRGLVADLVLGMACLRDNEAVAALESFDKVITTVMEVRDEGQRPYWIWEVLALAEAGRFLCRVPRTPDRAVAAFRKARSVAPAAVAPGAVRRSVVMLEALTGPVARPGMEFVRRAAESDSG